MTVKELNSIKRKMWDSLMENPEVFDNVKITGTAIIYDISDVHKHGIFVVNRPEQINDNMLTKNGFNAEKSDIKRLFTITASHNIIF